MKTESTPVLIVGAGLGGLSTAMFLGMHGVTPLVVERHPGTSTEPKARGQMPATMEALRVAGVAEKFLAANPPGRPAMTIVIATSVTGTVLHSFTNELPDFARFSPEPPAMVSQERAEPILAERATELGADLRFNTVLESFVEEPDGILATLRDRASGEIYQVKAQYLVGADGHRGATRQAAGIGRHGRGELQTSTSLLFEAKLDLVLDDSAVQMHYLQNPELPGGSGAFVSTDTPGRYVVGVDAPAGGVSDERAVELIRLATGIPDLEVTLLRQTRWSSACWVADTFAAGRVFLVGDAAHVAPPTGGQGGNTAIMDGYHLAWKLAAVLDGRAGPGLLASHDAERRPFAEALVEQQYANLVQRMAPHLADDTVAPIMDAARALFGYRAPAGAFVPEPGGELFEDPAAPSWRPGSRVPYRHPNLYARDFVLLTNDPGAWTSVDTTVVVHEAPVEGGVLVRPDGIIAWRGTDPADVAKALRLVLDR